MIHIINDSQNTSSSTIIQALQNLGIDTDNCEISVREQTFSDKEGKALICVVGHANEFKIRPICRYNSYRQEIFRQHLRKGNPIYLFYKSSNGYKLYETQYHNNTDVLSGIAATTSDVLSYLKSITATVTQKEVVIEDVKFDERILLLC